MALMAITLRHPWAFAVARLGKTIENRKWTPPKSLIGQTIAIHGGALPKGERLGECVADIHYINQNIMTPDYVRTLPETVRAHLKAMPKPVTVSDWITPGIVATAKLSGVVTASDSPWFSSPYGWVLEDVTPIEPRVSHRGGQGFWKVQDRALELIEAALTTPA